MDLLKQSTAVTVMVVMITTTDHIAGKTGLSAGLTIYASKAGTAPAAITPTVAELDSVNMPGWYSLALTTAHTNTLGELGLHITGSGADPTSVKFNIAAIDVNDTVRLGLTALPNAAAGASGGVLISGSNSGTTTFGALTVTGATTLTGAVSLGSTLGVTGLTTLGGLTTGAISATTITASGLTSLAAVTASGTLTLAAITQTGAVSLGATTINAMTVTNALTVSDGVIITASTANRSAISATGNGTGHGGVFTSGSGATGDGIQATAVSTNGNGFVLTKTGTGLAFKGATTDLTLAKTTNITGFNDIAATAIVSSGAITTSGGAVTTVTTVTNQLTAAAIATGVWTDATAGDFTVALSIGKSVMNGVALGTGLTINAYTGNTVQTGDSFGRIGALGAGLTGITGATLAATTGLGNQTANITGTITTATNVTTVNGLAANVITAASIADGAIDRATFAADTGLQSIRSNTAQAGAGTSITLDASASATTDFYKNALIVLTGGTGVGQGRYCTAYNGTTKVATVSAWATNPDVTSTFAIIAADAIVGATAPTAAAVATAVWQDLLAGSDFSTAASIGKLLKDDVDATVSSRMATYIQPTGFLAATFPGTVASTTNITAGTITTATNLTNLPTMPADWLTASGLATDAAQEIADTLLGRNVSGGSSAGRTVKQALHFIRNKWTVSAGTLTVYDTDDTTSSWTGAVTGTAGADPITANDPA